jgi:periplasmic divalent cation tolerance protein
VLVVYVTAPSADVALSIAEQLVAQQLVACVNVVSGVTSIYNWKV